MEKYFVIESQDGKTDLNGVIWQNIPKRQPRAILQIVHGMAEYIERYDDLAQFLNDNGILVIGHDHLGHGDSIDPDNPIMGYFSNEHTGSILIEDTYQITEYAQNRFPNIPIFMLGHSMGSFILRNYLKKYSDKVDGAILMGTSSRREDVKILQKIVKGLNTISPKTPNPAIDKLMFGTFNQKFKPTHSPYAWLSKNEDNIASYEQDEKCGFIFTNNGFATLLSLMTNATKKNWFQPIRRDLPLLIISGEKDPVGSFGKGPRKVALELTNNYFTNVTLRLYHELRHEILNETEAEDVMLDLYDWITHQLNQ